MPLRLGSCSYIVSMTNTLSYYLLVSVLVLGNLLVICLLNPYHYQVAEFPRLASQLYLEGEWAVTVSEIRSSEGSFLDAVVVSRSAKLGRNLARVGFYPEGTIEVPRRIAELVAYFPGDEKSTWGKSLVPSDFDKPIQPSAIYEMLSKNTARNLLSGHLLTVYFHPLAKLKKESPHIDVSGRWERELKYVLSNGESTLTAFTASVYSALTNWLEAAPAQLIALMEGVSVSTIRNRLNAAREWGLIEKPGAGVRSSKANKRKLS